MARDDFSIEYWWKERESLEPLGDHSAWPSVMQALFAFLARNKGGFRIKVRGVEATFELMPDLSTIFSELPHALATLKSCENILVELDMFEQGTDVGIVLRRQADQISVRFETAPGSGAPYQLLGNEASSIAANVFFYQWQRFLLAILDAMREVAPEHSKDESFVAYRATINELTSSDLS